MAYGPYILQRSRISQPNAFFHGNDRRDGPALSTNWACLRNNRACPEH